ncbi:D-site 20S pre-rRNA nuclease [Penicillium cf. griseofulvum]|uniref:20S-pre-rRNA D-site endonuclease NOB1 n=1 Tax=Penicillium cf. griseofulvum TaxID=2972120 RepID=A0A9W9JSZ6_9EURO|nr:D-site 20S pre-rRNA nuclease [Penicillium cf. griseofulvum]KAJ5442057.1 D-site 20S pre-rRNA nuclease [Penicillium cf. griseofulvum]KAJ5450970.1 D-site 20S pre-rRNA nuclease [Penicillium cf. griseofulvum]
MADTTAASTKPVHTIVLDAGPILKNTPPLSTLLAQCDEIITTPSVVAEIRDPDARARVETLYLPFLKQRSPTPKSFNVISEFARKTGDRSVLSRTDIEVLALAYEIECEKNDGDWRLRSVPGQKKINGKPPVKEESVETKPEDVEVEVITEGAKETTVTDAQEESSKEEETAAVNEADEVAEVAVAVADEEEKDEDQDAEDDAGDSDDGEWITPSNYKKRLAEDESGTATLTAAPKTMQVATMTTDFACQNVLLQMNLNLLSTTTLQKIQHLRTFIKRCHACFLTTKEMDKQFCPRCGKDTLTRVSCTTTANGAFTMHLKKNMQWNKRGNVYSVPKPIAGSANGKWKGGGGQRGWGTELVLAEDQKEYVRANEEEARRQRREHDLMDQDYLPGILTGERNRAGGRTKVGAGRNVNSKKRS